MAKKKKLVKNALKNPDKYTPAELKFFEIWLNHRKEQKSAKKGNTLQQFQEQSGSQLSSSSTNKQPLLLDRPATTSTLVTVSAGQAFSTSLIPTAVGNATKIFDVDSALTDTSISGAYIDEIWLQYSRRNIDLIDAQSPKVGTYSANGTTVTVTISTGHNLQVGQKVALDYTSYSSGTLPADEIITVTASTLTTFTGTTAASISGPITGNVNVYLPIDFCFYLVNTGTVTNINQFFPLFVASVPATFDNQTYSLTLNSILPLINHPVVQAGSNFTSANSATSPKMRGLMLQRGQALYAAVSGSTALTNGFYVNVQAGYY